MTNPSLYKKDIPSHLLKYFKLKRVNRWSVPNKNIWHKPNPMPSSGKGRFTNTYEFLYFMVKNTKPIMWIHRYTAEMVGKKPKDRTKIPCPECEGKGTRDVTLWEDSIFPETAQVECSECKGKGEVSIWHSEDYFFDLDAVRRPHKESSYQRVQNPIKAETMYKDNPGYHKQDRSDHTWLDPAGKNPGDVISYDQKYNQLTDKAYQRKVLGVPHDLANTHPAGANPGDFWSIPTQSSKLKHYASYPERLCLTPLKAGCPKWICKECGMARCRVTEKQGTATRPDKTSKYGSPEQDIRGGSETLRKRVINEISTLGWSFCSCLCPACGEADCRCGEKWRAGIVLDPFVGIGTTCIVAKKLGLSYLGIDLKKEYCEISKKRLKDVKYQEVFAL